MHENVMQTRCIRYIIILYIPLCPWQWLLQAVIPQALHAWALWGYSMYIALHHHCRNLIIVYNALIFAGFICGFRIFKCAVVIYTKGC